MSVKTTDATRLPIAKFVAIFVIVLGLVAFTAAVFGENQKVGVTAKHFMQRVAAREYDHAYDLLSLDAKAKMDKRAFSALMSQFRLYLTAEYGGGFATENKYMAKKKFWRPWLDPSRIDVSIGMYKGEGGIGGEVKEVFGKSDLIGPPIKDIFTIKREKGMWMIDAINFNPDDYADIINKHVAGHQQVFHPTETGFTLEGFVYDRKTIAADERALLIDQLTQALDEMRRDVGAAADTADDLYKLIP